MKKQVGFLTGVLTAATLATASANAAVTLVTTDSNLITSDSSVTSLSSSFDALTGNAVVVSAAARFGSASTALDATFAGQAADFSFIQGSGDRATVGTFVFLNPTITSGTVEVTASGGARLGYGVYSLENVNGVYNVPDSDPNDGIATDGAGFAGAPEGFGENGNSNTVFDLTYAGLAGGYQISTLSGEGPGTTPSITGDNIDVNPLYHANGDNNIFITAISSGGQIASTGEFITTNAYYQAGAMSTVVLYDAIPEPGTLALLGLGGIALISRRRTA